MQHGEGTCGQGRRLQDHTRHCSGAVGVRDTLPSVYFCYILRRYVDIHDINLKLRQQYAKREANHNQLLACLKVRMPRRCQSFASICVERFVFTIIILIPSPSQEVNRVISRFAALRIGAASTKLTAAARQGLPSVPSTCTHLIYFAAIAQNDIPTLFRILRAGAA